jgi:hypothetical protein
MSSKLFEVVEFYQMKGKYNRTKDAKLKEFAQHAASTYKGLSHLTGHSIATTLRHEAISHYKLQPARMNSDFIPNDLDCSTFVYQIDGNCFFSLGEETIFEAKLERIASEIGESSLDTLALWLEWIKKTELWMQTMHIDLTKLVLGSILAQKRFENYGIEVDKETIKKIQNNAIPVLSDDIPKQT